MDTNKHTEAPWRIYHNDEEGTHVMALGAENEEAYIVCEHIDNDADARLIAAAPDLLAALQEASAAMLQHLSGVGSKKDMRARWENAQAAIAKAT